MVLVVAWFYMFDVKVTPSKRWRAETDQVEPAKRSKGVDSLEVVAAVVPLEGYTVDINWGDTGQKLVAAGGIDMAKYGENYSDEKYQTLLAYLTSDQKQKITINSDNAYFWVNTLWALGLTQKSEVLSGGRMGALKPEQLANLAATGGWTLGAKEAMSLYNSTDILKLTGDQQKLVKRISEGVYRPCCGNSTAFPDCNHGMAALGLIELMVSQGSSEDDIYGALLAFNSYWFSQMYVDLANYWQIKENTAWADVDPKVVLAANFSSKAGYRKIKQQLAPVPAPGGSQFRSGCGV